MRTVACLLLLAACSGRSPVPLSLPSFSDWSDERRCECVFAGSCWAPELAEGDSEIRARQCRWRDRMAGFAECSFESRSRPAEPAAAGWSPWSKTILDFRHHGDKGWCWTYATDPDA